MKRTFLSCHLLLLVSFTSLLCMPVLLPAQEKDIPINPIPPSPNATTIQKYGNTDVSLYTGAINLGVPLFTAKSKNIALPVSLNYSGSGGIKVQEISSWVGIGWSLNAGGAISRTIQNRADDQSDGFTSLPPLSTSGANNSTLFGQFANGTKDGEPDIFYFNANGLSGKFVIKKGGEVFQIPQTELKIEAFEDNLGAVPYNGADPIVAFSITDTNGTVYWFSEIEESRSRRHPLSSNHTGDDRFDTSSWYLARITNSNETAEITLTYDPYTFIQYSEGVNHTATTNGTFNHWYTRIETNAKRLSRIDFEDGSIRFIATQARCDLAGDKYLERIELRNNTNQLINEFEFSYSYFDSNGTVSLSSATPCATPSIPYESVSDGDHNKRLRLDKVQEIGKSDAARVGAYEFSYNSSYYLPSRYSTSRDHWGYYNGASNGISLEPQYAVSYRDADGEIETAIFGSANRNPSNSKMKAGVLTKVTYPTGGSTSFSYESHKAENDEVNFYDVVGTPTHHSIRISEENVWSPTFTLSNNLNFDVELDINPSWEEVTQACQLDLEIKDMATGQLVANSWYNQLPLIKLPPGQYQAKFALLADVGCPHEPEFALLDIEWDNKIYEKNINIGGLRVKTIQDFTSENVLATHRTFKYENGSQSSGTLLSVPQYGFHQISEDSQGNIVPFGWIRTYYSNIPLATTKGSNVGYSRVTEYHGTSSNNIGKTEYYFTSPAEYPDINRGWTNNENEYDDQFLFNGNMYQTWVRPKTNDQDWRRGLLLKKEDYQKTSTGYSKVSETINDYEFLTPSDNPATDINPPNYFDISANDYVTGVVTDNSVDGTTYTKFYKYWSGRQNQTTQTERSFDSNEVLLLETVTNYYYENTDHRQVTRITSSDSKGRSVETRMKYPHDFTNTVHSNLLFKLRNQKSEVIEQTQLVGGVTVSGTKTSYDVVGDNVVVPARVWRLKKGESEFLSGSYVVDFEVERHDDDGNILEYVSRGGVRTSIVWGYNQNYPIAKIVNASFGEVAAAVGVSETTLETTASPDMLANLRKSPSMADAMVYIYTYEPLVGMTSQTDPNGVTTHYKYDAHNRLRAILDQDQNVLEKYSYIFKNQ